MAPSLRSAVFLAALAASVCSFAADTDGADARDLPYTHAQQLVDIDHGRRLNLYCVGQGSPTVVFDAGLGGNTASWDTIQPEIGQQTRACAYDRAGLGFSDPATRPGTSANIVDDLHRLLVAAGIKPPYILVGHSYGGMNVRLYADDYPTEVVGMVLVDPSHEDEELRAWQLEGQAAKTKWEESRAKALQGKRQCVAAAESHQLVLGSPLYKQCMPEPVSHWSAAMNTAMLRHCALASNQRAVFSEMENIDTASSDELRAARRRYGDMPLIVLTRAPAPVGQDETQEHRDMLNKLWVTLHDEIAALSTRGANKTVPYSGHLIQWDQPQVVVRVILEVMAVSREPVPPVGTHGSTP